MIFSARNAGTRLLRQSPAYTLLAKQRSSQAHRLRDGRVCTVIAGAMSVARCAMLEVLELSIYVAVLGSALMNATWNSMIRGDRDRDAMMMVMMLVEGALALCALPFIAVPGPGVWPWLLAG